MMNKISKTKTLKNTLFRHNNNYKFDPIQVLADMPKKLPTISIVIPYYESGKIIKKTLHHLYNSIQNTAEISKNWKYEVIIVDDGSKKHPITNYVRIHDYPNLHIIFNTKNLGRTITRNKGLSHSQYDICLFMDSDILIDSQLILNHLKIHAYVRNNNHKNAITVSFFQFTDESDPLLKYKTLTPVDLKLNDYRLHCVYGPTWIGCKEDKKFIGMEFRIVHDTKYFKNWKGMYKAWALTNMVLGGFFMVNRKDSLAVNGFNESFQGYGFTETSLPTKLISILGHHLIPMMIGGGIHVEDKDINISRGQKDKIFWQKHDFYFNKYLNLTHEKALQD